MLREIYKICKLSGKLITLWELGMADTGLHKISPKRSDLWVLLGFGPHHTPVMCPAQPCPKSWIRHAEVLVSCVVSSVPKSFHFNFVKFSFHI